MKTVIIAFCLIIIATNSYSRPDKYKRERSLKSISFNMGLCYAGYDINDYKSSFGTIPQQLDFPAKVTDNFPNVPYLSGEFLLEFKKLSFGLFYNNISTGGRIAYSDYSGTYHLDSKINTSTFGLVIFIKAHENEYFDIGLNIKGGYCDMANDVSETINIQDIKNITKSSSGYSFLNLEVGGRVNFYYSIFRLGVDFGLLTEFENATNVSWEGTRYALILGVRYKYL